MLARRLSARSVSLTGLPDIQGQVLMNDAIRPGLFASGVVAGWLESSAVLQKAYGKRLDIFQICDGDKERSAAAVLATELAIPTRSELVGNSTVPCIAVLQHGAVDSFIDYLQFRASEARSVALRYAKEIVSDHGVILTVHHEKEPQTDPDERIIAKIDKIRFHSFLKPKTSELTVQEASTGPAMDGLFADFIRFPVFCEWQITADQSDVNKGQAMWTVKNAEDTVIAGISRIAKHGNNIFFAAPFLTDAAFTDLPGAARGIESLVSHVLAIENAKTGDLLCDSKDPFKSFVSTYMSSKVSVEAADIHIGAIPAALGDEVEQSLLRTPIQVSAELLDWKLFNRM